MLFDYTCIFDGLIMNILFVFIDRFDYKPSLCSVVKTSQTVVKTSQPSLRLLKPRRKASMCSCDLTRVHMLALRLGLRSLSEG